MFSCVVLGNSSIALGIEGVHSGTEMGNISSRMRRKEDEKSRMSIGLHSFIVNNA